MARKFNPKSKILGRYFKEVPYGLREISSIFNAPLYKIRQDYQYKVVMLLFLIDKREENLNMIKKRSKSFIFSRLDSIRSIKYNEKEIISMIRGMSKIKKEYFLKYFIDRSVSDSFFQLNFINILREKDKNLKHLDKGYLSNYEEEYIWDHRAKEKTIKRIKGKRKNITFEILNKDDRRALFLDHYSDCCQGLGKAGEDCMTDGITNKDSSFLVFERKGTIFAQGWLRKIDEDILLIDSIEFKGEFNKSLIDAIKESVKLLNNQFKEIYLGLSPNRSEISRGLGNYKIYKNLEKGYLSNYKKENKNKTNKVFEFVKKTGIYSDSKKMIISLTEKTEDFYKEVLPYEEEIPF